MQNALRDVRNICADGVRLRQVVEFMYKFKGKELFLTLRMPVSGSKSPLLGTLEMAKRTRNESALA
jgi:hypothetical protein